MDGAVHTFKARLVAKGFTQTYRVDYEETLSPVADNRAIRILIAIAAYYDYEIWQMDVKTTFLNGYLSEDVYMEQPEGFVNPKYANRNAKQSIFATSSVEAEYVIASDASKESVWLMNLESLKVLNISVPKFTTFVKLANPFTKALDFPKHLEHTRNIGMLRASSFMQVYDD
ncbi:putative retrotransposon ty1-copia subclass protein [Tanacetum coccineum]